MVSAFDGNAAIVLPPAELRIDTDNTSRQAREGYLAQRPRRAVRGNARQACDPTKQSPSPARAYGFKSICLRPPHPPKADVRQRGAEDHTFARSAPVEARPIDLQSTQESARRANAGDHRLHFCFDGAFHGAGSPQALTPRLLLKHCMDVNIYATRRPRFWDFATTNCRNLSFTYTARRRWSFTGKTMNGIVDLLSRSNGRPRRWNERSKLVNAIEPDAQAALSGRQYIIPEEPATATPEVARSPDLNEID